MAFPHSLPVIPLRGTQVFPGAIVPVLLLRPTSIAALELAESRTPGQPPLVFAVLQREASQEDPTPDDLYPTGVVCQCISRTLLPGGMTKLMIEGMAVARITGWATVEPLEATLAPFPLKDGPAFPVLRQEVLALFRDYAAGRAEIPTEVLATLDRAESPANFLYTVAAFLRAEPAHRQLFLESEDGEALALLARDLLLQNQEVRKLERRVENEARRRISKAQRDYLLHEQMRQLGAELEDPLAAAPPEVLALQRRMEALPLPAEAKQKMSEELGRLVHLQPGTPEHGVVQGWIEAWLSLPWGVSTTDQLNLRAVEKALEHGHWGLKEPKTRLLEHVAVLQRAPQGQGPILCLVGPPGTGKTSLARGAAEALGRKFVRIALGGVRDEAEIRGHRRTYIGSMPGRIVEALRRAGAMNPVILLDEIDKMGSDFRGDPGSALLEVLDPEQNRAFRDHYLECGLDLSQVLFLCTANVAEQIPPVLRDRMELIRLSGYPLHEKVEIARRHLLPRICERSGLAWGTELEVDAEAIAEVARGWTREAGVRDLERKLDALARRRALDLARQGNPKRSDSADDPTPKKGAKVSASAALKSAASKVSAAKSAKSSKLLPAKVNSARLEEVLGPAPFRRQLLAEEKVKPGIVTGLAWTAAGGEVLKVECVLVPGKGRLKMTGTLGEVMKESVQIAHTLVRQRAAALGIAPEVFAEMELHVHLPEGAIPKDGPSAGVALVLAIASACLRKPVPATWAFTGEVSLSGGVHAIGGLPEKGLAALDAGATFLFAPEENAADLRKLPVELRKGLKIVQLAHIDTILKRAFAK